MPMRPDLSRRRASLCRQRTTRAPGSTRPCGSSTLLLCRTLAELELAPRELWLALAPKMVEAILDGGGRRSYSRKGFRLEW